MRGAEIDTDLDDLPLVIITIFSDCLDTFLIWSRERQGREATLVLITPAGPVRGGNNVRLRMQSRYT
jgi:hypothetical protein